MPNKGKILAVDDTPPSLKLLTSILKEEGYEVRGALGNWHYMPPSAIRSEWLLKTIEQADVYTKVERRFWVDCCYSQNSIPLAPKWTNITFRCERSIFSIINLQSN